MQGDDFWKGGRRMEQNGITRVIMVRHGQSLGNAEGFFAGQTDIPLTELGLKQAERTAEYLRERKIDRIYSSTLQRSMQTAGPTANIHRLPILPEEGLREIFAGQWEHLAYTEITERYPESRAVWKEHIGLACPEGGESVAHVAERVRETVERLVDENRGKCIALFTHALPIRSMGCFWQGIPIAEMERLPWAPNAAVTEADYMPDGQVRLVCYGYNKHQHGIETEFPQGAV